MKISTKHQQYEVFYLIFVSCMLPEQTIVNFARRQILDKTRGLSKAQRPSTLNYSQNRGINVWTDTCIWPRSEYFRPLGVGSANDLRADIAIRGPD